MTRSEFLSIVKRKLYEDDRDGINPIYDRSAGWDQIPFWLKIRYECRADQILRIITSLKK